MAEQKTRPVFKFLGAIILALAFLAVVYKKPAEVEGSASAAVDTSAKVSSKAMANQQAVCDYRKMSAQGIEHLSWADAEAVCSAMAASLSNPPSLDLLSKMTKMIFVMRVAGYQAKPKDIAYHVMNIVESRHQLADNAAIGNTLEMVMKIFNGTQGHVTPKDISITLRQMGPQAAQLSDEGIFNIAALLLEQKKDAGE